MITHDFEGSFLRAPVEGSGQLPYTAFVQSLLEMPPIRFARRSLARLGRRRSIDEGSIARRNRQHSLDRANLDVQAERENFSPRAKLARSLHRLDRNSITEHPLVRDV